MQFPNRPKPSSDDNNEQPEGGGQRPQFQPPSWVMLLVLFVALSWLFLRVPDMVTTVGGGAPIEIPYSFFLDQAEAGTVENVTIRQDQAAGEFSREVTYPPPGSPELENGTVIQQTSSRFIVTIPPVDDGDLIATLRANDVTIVGEQLNPPLFLEILITFGPLLLIGGFLFWTLRRSRQQMSGVFGFGRSQAKEYDPEKPSVTFADVAGQDAAKDELVEVVDFLKEPDKYIALGARIPRGVLLVGPPGTGKTLMARAVAGEAGVAFFSIAASEFVEMFVGVGASRVRDLFGKAKAAAPAIVFIDEIDAVGRQRGAGLGGGNDEREQTLNQMLAEMDGFDQTESVIVMAATNRPDVLDPALLRPGRFDRQVTVGLPDREGRKSILNIHTRGKPLAADVDLESLAGATIGFSGADISNLANEAALTAARNNRKQITPRDFSDAFDRIVLGIERPPLSNQHERRVVAFHEAGHAVLAALLPDADPVHKVTIVPRGQAGGVTAFMPDDDRRLFSREYIQAQMIVLLGGRTAEEIAIGQITNGAENDLRRVTQLARRMVAQWGMSEAIGSLNFGDDDRQPFLGYSLSQGRDYSEQTAAAIDTEVRRLVEDAHKQARHLLSTNRDKLDALAQELLESEVVDKNRMLEVIGMTEDEIESDHKPETSEERLSG